MERISGKTVRMDTVKKDQVYSVQDDNSFLIKLTYKQVSHYVNLPIIERKLNII